MRTKNAVGQRHKDCPMCQCKPLAYGEATCASESCGRVFVKRDAPQRFCSSQCKQDQKWLDFQRKVEARGEVWVGRDRSS